MKKLRHTNDAYWTNSKLVEHLLIRYPISKDKVILEPCNGKGHISNYLKEVGYEVVTNDIDTNTTSDYYYDFTSTDVDYKYKLASKCSTVITNPPFNVAEKILANSLDIADEVIMLLRLSFCEPVKGRKDILNKYKDNLVKCLVINPRPQFRNDCKGTDSVTVAWFIWQQSYSWNKLGIDYPFDFITDWK